MEEVKKYITVYKVGDEEFIDKEEAKKFEDSIQEKLNYTYFIVHHSPDLTEGRGYEESEKFAVPSTSKEIALAIMQEYCFKHYGSPVAYVMGVSLMANWIISECMTFKTLKQLKNFDKLEVHKGIGDYCRRYEGSVTVLNDRAEVQHVGLFK